MAPEDPAVAVAPDVTAGTPLEELDVSGAKPKTRFTLPFDFPNPFTFPKSKTPAVTPVFQPPVAPDWWIASRQILENCTRKIL